MHEATYGFMGPTNVATYTLVSQWGGINACVLTTVYILDLNNSCCSYKMYGCRRELLFHYKSLM